MIAEIVGLALILDGDSLVLSNQRVRLHGIDAPEMSQTCSGTPCGERAKFVLQTLSDGKIRCVPTGEKSYNRLIAKCYRGNIDLSREMVRHGWAVAYRRYSLDYASDEEYAREGKLGIWKTNFILPEVYRHR